MMNKISLITSMVINFIHLLCSGLVLLLWVYIQYLLSFPMSSENGFINSEDRDLSLAILAFILQLYFFEAIFANTILGSMRLKQYLHPINRHQKYHKLAITLTYLNIYSTFFMFCCTLYGYYSQQISLVKNDTIYQILFKIAIPSYLVIVIISTIMLGIIWGKRYLDNQKINI